ETVPEPIDVASARCQSVQGIPGDRHSPLGVLYLPVVGHHDVDGRPKDAETWIGMREQNVAEEREELRIGELKKRLALPRLPRVGPPVLEARHGPKAPQLHRPLPLWRLCRPR